MQINTTIINDLESGEGTTRLIDEWFNNLHPKYQFEQYIPPYISNYFAYLMDHDIDFKMKSSKDKKHFYIDYLKKNAGLHFLASGTNRMCFTSEIDPDVIVKLAYNSGRSNADNELYIQDKLKPHVTKTFGATPDGIFSLHERVKEIGSKEDLYPFADQHFMLMMDFYERGYIIEDVGTKTFRNLGIRPNYGLVLLDYPTVYQVRPGDLKCACGGRIFYDAGFNRLQCHTCGRVFTASSLSNNAVRNYKELQQQQIETVNHNEYNGGTKMRFELVLTDENGNETTKEFDTKNYKETPQQREFERKTITEPEGLRFNNVKAKLVFDDGSEFKFKNNARKKLDNRNRDRNNTSYRDNRQQPKYEQKPSEPVQKPVIVDEEPVVVTETKPEPVFEATVISDNIVDIDAESAVDANSDIHDKDEDYYNAVFAAKVVNEVIDTLSDLYSDDLMKDILAELNNGGDENDEFVGHNQSISSESEETTGEDTKSEEDTQVTVRESGTRPESKTGEEVMLDDGVETSSKYPAKKSRNGAKSLRANRKDSK